MTFIDLFAGIGGFRLGLERNGFKCMGYSEIDKFAIQTYRANFDTKDEVFWNDITRVTTDEFMGLRGKIDIIAGGFPCFVAGTMITTRDMIKPIEEVEIGDEVLTHRNRYMPVTDVMSRVYRGTLYDIKAAFNMGVEGVTPEHPFYIRRTFRKWDCKVRNYDRIYTSPEWVDAKDIREGDYIRVSVSKDRFVNDFTYTHGINATKSEERTMELKNPDFWWCVGYYLAEGHYQKRRKRNGHYRTSSRVVFSCNKNDVHYAFAKVRAVFNRGCLAEEPTTTRIHLIHRGFYEFVRVLGDNAKEKKLPDGFHNLPTDLLNAMIEGYFFGDGHRDDKYGVITSATASERLGRDVQAALMILRKRGVSCKRVHTRPTTVIEGRVVNQSDYYQVRVFDPGSKMANSYFDGEALWIKVKSIKQRRSYVGTVFNLSVKGDETYTANGITVHNCQSFSMAGKRGGFDDTRGTLVFNVLEAARIIQPRYLVLENVKGLLSHAGGTTAGVIFNALGELGYFAEWQICNSKNFGVPQHRERIYIVGHLGGEPRRKVFPLGGANSKALAQVGNIDQRGHNSIWGRVYSLDGLSATLNAHGGGLGAKIGLYAVPVTSPVREEVRPRERRFRDVEGTTPTLTAIDRHGVMTVPVLTPMRENNRQMSRRFKTDGEPSFTLTAQDRHGVLQTARGFNNGGVHPDVAPTVSANSWERNKYLVNLRGPDEVSKTVRCGGRGSLPESKQNHDSVYDGTRIRMFTPLECFRLQGFPDSHYHNARAAGLSDNQLYRQAGNAVTVSVVEAIGAKLREISRD